jgi:hypothetical protein
MQEDVVVFAAILMYYITIICIVSKLDLFLYLCS